MEVIQLHIVGFPYRKDIEGHVSEFLAEAPGHAMTLRPHHGNSHDKLAIRAFDWLPLLRNAPQAIGKSFCDT